MIQRQRLIRRKESKLRLLQKHSLKAKCRCLATTFRPTITCFRQSLALSLYLASLLPLRLRLKTRLLKIALPLQSSQRNRLMQVQRPRRQRHKLKPILRRQISLKARLHRPKIQKLIQLQQFYSVLLTKDQMLQIAIKRVDSQEGKDLTKVRKVHSQMQILSKSRMNLRVTLKGRRSLKVSVKANLRLLL